MAEHRVHLSRAARPAYQALSAFSKTVGDIAAQSGVDDRLKELVQIHASQLNGCAYCVRVHVERAVAAGVTADVIAQVPVWRDSGVFSERERAGLELAEAHVFIHDDGVPAEFGRRVADDARPIDDHRSTAAYRRHGIGVLAERALRRAFGRISDDPVSGAA